NLKNRTWQSLWATKYCVKKQVKTPAITPLTQPPPSNHHHKVLSLGEGLEDEKKTTDPLTESVVFVLPLGGVRGGLSPPLGELEGASYFTGIFLNRSFPTVLYSLLCLPALINTTFLAFINTSHNPVT